MKYLGTPHYDDISILEKLCALSDNRLLKVAQIKNLIKHQYSHYDLKRGNGLELRPPIDMDEETTASLHLQYRRPKEFLVHIEDIRKKTSGDVCPMCGSLRTGEVDHFIPKSTYPEYSIFSRNLITACYCNRKKSTFISNPNTGERLLHPYYDEILRNRLAYIRFSGNISVPTVNVQIRHDFRINKAVQCHLERIVSKSGILEWVGLKWATIQRCALSIIPLINAEISEINDQLIIDMIDQQVWVYDNQFNTPNNWFSMFYYGLKFNPKVVSFITQKVREEILMPSRK